MHPNNNLSQFQPQLPTYQQLIRLKNINREKRKSIFQINREKLSVPGGWNARGQFQKNHFTLVARDQMKGSEAARSNSSNSGSSELVARTQSNSLLLKDARKQRIRLRMPPTVNRKGQDSQPPNRLNKIKFIQLQFTKAKAEVIGHEKNLNSRSRICSLPIAGLHYVRTPQNKHNSKEKQGLSKKRAATIDHTTGDSRVRYEEIPPKEFLYEQESKAYSRGMSRRAQGVLRNMRSRSEASVF